MMAKKSILVVEDEDDIRELPRYNLAKEGYQVTGSASGEEALKAVRVSLPDLVALGRRYQLLVVEDLGSGCLVDLSRYGIEREPTVQETLKAGADPAKLAAHLGKIQYPLARTAHVQHQAGGVASASARSKRRSDAGSEPVTATTS